MVLKIEDVTKRFGDKVALNAVSFEIKSGITGLLGPNGAGKSTLMRLIATIDNPTQGKIFYNEVDIGKQPNAIRMGLGYLPQDFGVYPNLNPIEFLEYMAAMKSLSMQNIHKRIDELLTVLHLNDARKRKIGSFSGGMRQRVGIAQALLNDPEVLIVDEPTVGLDPQERIQFRNLLSSLSSNRIIILSTHIVSDIESIAPKIAIMFSGDLLVHTTPEVLMQEMEGKVWDCIVSTIDFPGFQQKYAVSSSIHRSNGVQARVISNEKPISEATPVVPSLEDAYLYKTNISGVTQQ